MSTLPAFAGRVGATDGFPVLAAGEHQLGGRGFVRTKRYRSSFRPGASPAAARSIPPGCSRARAGGRGCSGTGTTTSARQSSGARATISASRSANQSPRRVTSSYLSSTIASIARRRRWRSSARGQRRKNSRGKAGKAARSPAPPTAETKGRPQHRHIGSAMRSNPSRQLSADRNAAGVRQGVAADPARAGEKDRCECVERAFQDHGCVVNRRRYGETLLANRAAREET